MQAAAGRGDFILAGKLQEELKRLEDLCENMQVAAQQNDFIRAGRLQAQFKALTANATKTTDPNAVIVLPDKQVKLAKQAPSAWTGDHSDSSDDDDHGDRA